MMISSIFKKVIDPIHPKGVIQNFISLLFVINSKQQKKKEVTDLIIYNLILNYIFYGRNQQSRVRKGEQVDANSIHI